MESVRDRPFEWGAWDCCRFAAGAVQAMIGENPMKEFRYTDRESAETALNEEGAGTLYKTMVRKFGRPLSASAARRGDIVYAVHEGPTLGVCLGRESAFVTDTGLEMRPTLDSQRVFRCG